MIHTLNIGRIIPMCSAYRLVREVFSVETAEALRSGRCTVEEIYLSDDFPGIIKLTVLRQGDDFVSLDLEIEPQALLLGQRTIQLFNCSPDAVVQLEDVFLETLKALSVAVKWRPLREWYLHRIDYAVNLTTLYPAELIELGKKGWLPYHYQDHEKKKGSLYWQTDANSVHFNWYDKADHVRNTMKHLPEFLRLLDEAKNIFRIEVQCLKASKIKGLIKTYQLPNQQVLPFLQPYIALQVVESYYQRVIGSGDYYNLYHASKKITEQNLSPRMNKKIIDFLSTIAQVQGMDAAYRCLVDGNGYQLKNGDFVSKISKSTFQNYENICRMLGINPVTIPKNKGTAYIENPMPAELLSLYRENGTLSNNG